MGQPVFFVSRAGSQCVTTQKHVVSLPALIMKWWLHTLLLTAFVGCSTPEERIEELHQRLRAGEITMDQYNVKFRKLDQKRIQETRESFMR